MEEAYRNKVVPLAEEYRRVRADKSGRGRRFEQKKLATLDGLHEKIASANEQFKEEAAKTGLDSAYYVRKYAGSLGDGNKPSAVEARAKRAADLAKAKKREDALREVLSWLLRGCFWGCFWTVAIGISLFVTIGLLLMLVLI